MPNIIYEGEKYTIESAICSDGSIPSKNFIKALPKKGRAKINALFKLFVDKGEIRDTRKFKKFKGVDLCEFGYRRKPGQFLIMGGIQILV